MASLAILVCVVFVVFLFAVFIGRVLRDSRREERWYSDRERDEREVAHKLYPRGRRWP